MPARRWTLREVPGVCGLSLGPIPLWILPYYRRDGVGSPHYRPHRTLSVTWVCHDARANSYRHMSSFSYDLTMYRCLLHTRSLFNMDAQVLFCGKEQYLPIKGNVHFLYLRLNYYILRMQRRISIPNSKRSATDHIQWIFISFDSIRLSTWQTDHILMMQKHAHNVKGKYDGQE